MKSFGHSEKFVDPINFLMKESKLMQQHSFLNMLSPLGTKNLKYDIFDLMTTERICDLLICGFEAIHLIDKPLSLRAGG